MIKQGHLEKLTFYDKLFLITLCDMKQNHHFDNMSKT